MPRACGLMVKLPHGMRTTENLEKPSGLHSLALPSLVHFPDTVTNQRNSPDEQQSGHNQPQESKTKDRKNLFHLQIDPFLELSFESWENEPRHLWVRTWQKTSQMPFPLAQRPQLSFPSGSVDMV